MAGPAVGGVKICDKCVGKIRGMESDICACHRQLQIFPCLVCYHLWVNPLKCVIHHCVVRLGSPFEKKIKSLNRGEHYLCQPNRTWKTQVWWRILLERWRQFLFHQRASLCRLDLKKKKKEILVGSSRKSIVLILNSTKWHKNKECIFRKRKIGKNNKL